MEGGNFFPKKISGQSSALRDWHDLAKKQRQDTCFASALTFPDGTKSVLTLLTFTFWASQQLNCSASLGSWEGRQSFSCLGSCGRAPAFEKALRLRKPDILLSKEVRQTLTFL